MTTPKTIYLSGPMTGLPGHNFDNVFRGRRPASNARVEGDQPGPELRRADRHGSGRLYAARFCQYYEGRRNRDAACPAGDIVEVRLPNILWPSNAALKSTMVKPW